MAITTDKNTSYGGPLVTQKYSPLLNIGHVAGDKAYYSALLTNRCNMLVNAHVLPRSLVLRTKSWPDVLAAEAGNHPPLIVISSNRSKWIKKGIDAADLQLLMLGEDEFADASDLRALTAQNAEIEQSPPLYCPKRTGANRSVYIVVHSAEYATYHAALKDTGITVVGWHFNTAQDVVQVDRVLAGFGASRFAAIEFCKEIRRSALALGPAPWDYAWLLDDNVVALNGFPGYAAVEAALAGANDHACAGFHGGTKAETFLTNRNWARTELQQGRGEEADDLPPAQAKGIIQQASCWNIAYLMANNLNFSPIYVSSGEDLSFCSFFDMTHTPYFYYTGIGVRKEATAYDNGSAAQRVNQARQAYCAWFAAAESAGMAAALPPPVQVSPVNGADGGVQTLGNFIVNRVLPNSLMMADAGNAAVQNQAKCQAVEQITCGAIGKGYVSQPALDATFQINQAAQPPVIQVSA